MQSLSSLSSLAALGWRKTAKNIFRFTLSSITGAVPITLVTSQGGGVVNWGDGTTTTLTSGTNSLSHTYTGYSSAVVTVSEAQRITQLTYNASTASLGCTAFALPRALTSLFLGDYNTLSGNVSGLPRGLTYLYVFGSNTLSGDVSGLPSGLTYLNVFGSNTISAYTSRPWPTSMRRVQIITVSPGGLPATAVDQLLIDLAAYATTWTNEKNIALQGASAPRTSASNAAVATLQSRGVTVTTY